MPTTDVLSVDSIDIYLPASAWLSTPHYARVIIVFVFMFVVFLPSILPPHVEARQRDGKPGEP